MKRLLSTLSLLMMILCSTSCSNDVQKQDNPLLSEWNTPYGVPPFDLIETKHYEPAFKQAMSLHNAEIEAIIANSEEPTFENTIAEYDHSGRMLADLSNHREWSFRKAFCFFRDAAVYFFMVASIYLLGHLKGEEQAAVQCVSFMIYVAIYFYGTNILRNARMITREESTLFKVLDFLYYVFSLKIMEHSNYLKDYFEYYGREKSGRAV